MTELKVLIAIAIGSFCGFWLFLVLLFFSYFVIASRADKEIARLVDQAKGDDS